MLKYVGFIVFVFCHGIELGTQNRGISLALLSSTEFLVS